MNFNRNWDMTLLGQNGLRFDNVRQVPLNVMNYNVLADQLMKWHPELYSSIPENLLDWEFRWSRIKQEVQHYNPDILCLQEVQADHFSTHFAPDLFRFGLAGIYKQRTGDKCDGCAIFYNASKFQLLDHLVVEYFQPNVSVLDRDNVAILAKFKPKDSDNAFVVATTHLLFNQKRTDIKLAQLALLFAELDRFAVSEDRRHPYLPIIVTGDFNMPPSNPIIDEFVLNGGIYVNDFLRSPMYLLPPDLGVTDECRHLRPTNRLNNHSNPTKLCQGHVITYTANSAGENRHSQLRREEMPAFGTGELRHNFRFRSVYKNIPEKEVSAIGGNKGKSFHVVDFMFYSTRYSPRYGRNVEGKLKLVSRLSLPSSSQLKDLGGIPCADFPSDHVCLVAKFILL